MIEKLYNLLHEIAQSLTTILKIVMRSNYFLNDKIINKNQIFIIGNGPSFVEQYNKLTSILYENHTLCVNGFSLSNLYKIIKPNYYLVTSPGFYNTNATDYNVELRKKVISKIISDTQWPLTLFLPIGAKKQDAFINNIKGNKKIKIQYFNTTPIEGFSSVNFFLLKHGLGCPRPHNVLIPSILRAINMRYKKIYLLGADHSWLPLVSVNNRNEVLINQKHFYDKGKSTAKQMHKNEGKGNRLLHEVLHKWMVSFKSYHLLEYYANTMDSKIYNLTKCSFIDAFEKTTYIE